MLGFVFVGLFGVFLQLCRLQATHGRGDIGPSGIPHEAVVLKAKAVQFVHRVAQHL
jgi:hypothetical protein